jgi:hypothetical protein
MNAKHAFIFRILTLATLVSYVATVALSQKEVGAVAELVAEIGIGGGYISPYAQWLLSWVQAWVLVICMLGLLLFSPLARLGLVVVLVSSVVGAAISGMTATSPRVNALWSVHDLLFTFMLGMAYFHPPIRSRFEAKGRESKNGNIAPGA